MLEVIRIAVVVGLSVTALAPLVPAAARGGSPTAASAPERGDIEPSPVRAGFSVRFHDITTPYRVFMMRALPGERVKLDVISGSGAFSARATGGQVRELSEREFEWVAPEQPGVYPVTIRSTASAADSMVLNAIVMVPLQQAQGGTVDGYRVGEFPSRPYRDMPQYLPPPGFIQLTPDNGGTQVSPHFELGQFPAKAPQGFPKYLVLSERLLLKLELLLEESRRRGLNIETFQVLSGFRSPWYNAGIGRPRYSRHIYGDAADIYVDDDGDGRMDDLNGDGRVDIRDAAVLYTIVEEMDGDPSTQYLLGGLGKYPVTPNHGPFIHVDTRLWRARW